MNTPLTQQEKRKLLQLMYLAGRAQALFLADEFDPETPSWPPTVPEDYDELLANGPYGLWQISAGGAFDFAEELAVHSGIPIQDSSTLIQLAMGASCRGDTMATQRYIDEALIKLREEPADQAVEPHAFGWTGSLLERCYLGMACFLIGDRDRLAIAQENTAEFLNHVEAWIEAKGQNPLPDCAHEMRIMLDIGWYDQVRFVLRHLDSIYCFIGSYAVNLRLMESLIAHGMQEHILTMVGAGTDAMARNNFREAAMCAAISQGKVALAWDMLTKMERQEERSDLSGCLAELAEHAATFRQLHHWKTILDWNEGIYRKPLDTKAQFHWMMSVSHHGDDTIRKEVWEKARMWEPPAEGEYQDVAPATIEAYQLVIAAFAGDRLAVQVILEKEDLALEYKLLRNLREAAVLNDIDFAVEWAQSKLEGQENERIIQTLELELLKMRANKTNLFWDSFNHYKELVIREPEQYNSLGRNLIYFARNRLRDVQSQNELRLSIGKVWVSWRDFPGVVSGNIADTFSEAIKMDAFYCNELLNFGGFEKCLIHRFGIQEKIDRFDSGRGL